MERRSRPAISLTLIAAGLISLLVAPQEASAIPAFARQYGLACSQCHTVWPALNSFGRKFKEAGFTTARGEPEGQTKINDALSLPASFPLAAIVKSRPYDKRRGQDASLRVLQEVELLFAGNFFRYGSVFAELEMEDEVDYQPELVGTFGLHPHQLFNVLAGKATTFAADPYDTLSNMRRITRNRRLPLNQAWSAGARVDDEVPMIAIYGRDTKVDRVFWAASYSADVGDPEGEGPNDVTGRLVVDLATDVSVGGFVMSGAQNGTVDKTTKKLDYSRYGFDLQARYKNFNALAVYLQSKDDIFRGGRETNSSWYTEVFYTITHDALQQGSFPGFMLVPIVRVDRYERNNGLAGYTDLTLNLSYLPWENTKAFIEYTRAIDRPTAGPKDWRVVGQFVLAF